MTTQRTDDDDNAPPPLVGPTTGDGPTFEPFNVQEIPLAELEPHALNPNRESESTFEKLVGQLYEDGPDQTIVVVPLPEPTADGKKYRIIKGEHRYLAALKLGWPSFPCTVRHNWTTDLAQKTRLVRDNTVRGELNADRFTALVESIRAEHLDSDLTSAMLGFDSTQEMFDHMVQEEKREQKAKDALGAEKPDDARAHAKEDLARVINTLFATYGDTIPQGFIAFAYGGQMHVMVEMGSDLQALMAQVQALSINRKVDISILLATMIRDGLPTL